MKQILFNLGLSEKAVLIYLELLQKGVSSVSELAKSTGIGRTAIYPYITELKNLDIVSWDEGQVNKAVKAKNPQVLKNISQKKLQLAEQIDCKVDKLLPEIKAMYRVSSSSYSVQKYIGVYECRQALQMAYEFKQQNGYCGEFVYDDLGKKWYEEHLRKMYKIHKVNDRVLFPKPYVNKNTYKELKKTNWYDEVQADYRYHPDLIFPRNFDVYIFPDRVLNIFSQDGQTVCTIVKSQQYRDYEQGLFETVWKTSVNLKDYK